MKYQKIEPWKYRTHALWATQISLLSKLPDFTHEFFEKEGDAILIKRGYAWDGPTGPVIHTKSTIRASLIHDCLYQAISLGLIHKSQRKVCDQIYHQVAISGKMWGFRAFYHYWAIRKLYPVWAKRFRPDYEKVYEV